METITRKCGRCHNKLELSYYTGDMKLCDKCLVISRDSNKRYRGHTQDTIA